MKIHYHNKRFRPVSNTENGEIAEDTIFEYKQTGCILSATYCGNQIEHGHLLGLVDENGNIEMCYHQINKSGKLMTGICFSKPEILKNGKIRLHEIWEWTSGDLSKGQSVLEEM